MPLRDIGLTLFVFALIPVCLRRPWIGVVAFYWMGLMNPHRLTWDFAYNMPFAMMLGAATLLAVPFARDRRPIPWNQQEVILTVVLMAYFTFTTLFAWNPEHAWKQWEMVAKIILMSLVATMFIYGRDRVRALLLIVVLSLGFHGLRWGIHSLVASGSRMVTGPEGCFLSGNTFIGLGLITALPLIVAAARDQQKRWFAGLLYLTALLTVVAAIFTYSRGAWLGLAIVLPLIALQFRRGMSILVAASLVGAVIYAPRLLPEKVFTRVETIREYEKDGSANQRLMAWSVHYNIAREHPFTGAGFQLEYTDYDRWVKYGDEKYIPFLKIESGLAAHSNYFQVLGQHGVVAFVLYLWLLIGVHVRLWRLRKQAAKSRETEWIGNYARGIQIGLIGYCVSGAFLSAAYFDLAWLYFMLVPILSRELASSKNAVAESRGVGQYRSQSGGVMATLRSGKPGTVPALRS